MLIIDLFGSFLFRLERIRTRLRGRRALLQMDQRMLNDIGVRREDAIREGNKPFWRA